MEPLRVDIATSVAYGHEGRAVGALCFFAESGQRDCASLHECRRRMTAERQRVFRRINEMAAHGDKLGEHLASEFSHPAQVLDGETESEPER